MTQFNVMEMLYNKIQILNATQNYIRITILTAVATILTIQHGLTGPTLDYPGSRAMPYPLFSEKLLRKGQESLKNI